MLDEAAFLNKNHERFERYFTRHESNSQPKKLVFQNEKLISQGENLYSQNEKLISETQDVTSDKVGDELSIDVTETLNEPVASEVIDTNLPAIDETELPATPQPPAKDHCCEIDSSKIVNKPRRSKLLLNRIYHCYKLTMASSVLPSNRYRNIHFRSDKDAWLKAYQLELDKLTEISQMKVVTKPANVRAIPLFELFVWKWDNLNAKEIPKCRFVARGDLQAIKGDTFSPVASNLSFRLLLFLASTWKTTISQLDVRNASYTEHYLNPFICSSLRDILMQNFTTKFGLLLDLYMVCVKTSRHWNHTIEHFLLSFGFYNLQTEPCLFAYNEGGKRQKKSDDKSNLPFDILLALYVDDIIFSGHSKPVSLLQESNFKTFFKSNLRTQQKSTLASTSYRKRIWCLSTNIDTSTKRWNDLD